jgi:hypothetical protein
LSQRLAYLAPTTVALALVLLAALSFASTARGQEHPPPTEIEFTSKYGSTLEERHSALIDITEGGVTVEVGGVVCTSIQFSTEMPLPVALVGTADQPEICSVPGGTIRVYNAEGRHLISTRAVAPGKRYEIIDLQYWPGEEWGWITIEFGVPPSEPVLMLADGALCAIASLYAPEDFNFRFMFRTRDLYGNEPMPGECSRHGAELVFYTASGSRFGGRVTLDTTRPIYVPVDPGHVALGDPNLFEGVFSNTRSCLDERTRRTRAWGTAPVVISFDAQGHAKGCASEEVYQALGNARTLNAPILRSVEAWADGRVIPDDLVVADLPLFYPNLREPELSSTPVADQITITRAPQGESDRSTPPSRDTVEATATDTTATTRNVAASVVAAIVVAGLVALGVEARARRRGGREAR